MIKSYSISALLWNIVNWHISKPNAFCALSKTLIKVNFFRFHCLLDHSLLRWTFTGGTLTSAFPSLCESSVFLYLRFLLCHCFILSFLFFHVKELLLQLPLLPNLVQLSIFRDSTCGGVRSLWSWFRTFHWLLSLIELGLERSTATLDRSGRSVTVKIS